MTTNKKQSYYDILEVTSKSTKEEIKKSYRSLSMKYHPDRNKNDTNMVSKIQIINEAYEVLSDEDSRKEYDRKMTGGNISGQNYGQNVDINSIFTQLFNSGALNGLKMGIRHGRPNNINVERPPVPRIITHKIELDFCKIFEDQVVQFEIERDVFDVSKNESNKENEKLYIKIPKGIDNNEIIIIPQKGNIIMTDEGETRKGDIKVFINIANNSEFKRKGLDIFKEHKITLKESLCGIVFEINHPNGKKYTLNNIKGSIIENGHNKIIPNCGIKRDINGMEHVGNLVIVFSIEYPKILTDAQINKLNDIL